MLSQSLGFLFLKSSGFIEFLFEQFVIKIKEIINKIDFINFMSRIITSTICFELKIELGQYSLT